MKLLSNLLVLSKHKDQSGSQIHQELPSYKPIRTYSLQQINSILQSIHCSFIIMLIYFMGGVGRWGPDTTLLNAIKKGNSIATVIPVWKEKQDLQ